MKTSRSRVSPCSRSADTAASDVTDGAAERGQRAAEIKQWWTAVFRLVDKPTAAAAIFRDHEPDDAGLCTVCASPDEPRNLPWPCRTHSMAENALILRANRDRAARGDRRPLR